MTFLSGVHFFLPVHTVNCVQTLKAAANYAWVNRSSMTFLCRQAFVRCSVLFVLVLDEDLHSWMLLGFTIVLRLKLDHACDGIVVAEFMVEVVEVEA